MQLDFLKKKKEENHHLLVVLVVVHINTLVSSLQPDLKACNKV